MGSETLATMKLIHELERIANSLDEINGVLQVWTNTRPPGYVRGRPYPPDVEDISALSHPPLDLDLVPEIVGADNEGEGGHEV
jgi:hypothetical protein